MCSNQLRRWNRRPSQINETALHSTPITVKTMIAGTFEPSAANDIVPIAHTRSASRAIAEMPSTARLSMLAACPVLVASHCTMKPPMTVMGEQREPVEDL